MNWIEYRRLCDSPDVHSRYLLGNTAGLLEVHGGEDLARRLRAVCASVPIPKPEGHRGPPASDFFRFEVDADDLQALVDRLVALREQGLCLPDGRSMGGVVEAWQEHLDWVCGVHPRQVPRENR